MAENMTTALRSAIYDYFFRPEQTAPDRPQGLYLALFTTPTNTAGNGTEVSGVNYARQLVELGAPFAVGNKLRIANTNEISFPVTGSAWGTVTHAALMTALGGGVMYLQGSLPEPVVIGQNFTYQIAAGELVFDLT